MAQDEQLAETANNGSTRYFGASLRSGYVRLFRSYVPVLFIWLGLAEGLLMYASMYIAVWLRTVGHYQEVVEDFGPIWPKAVVWCLVMIPSMTAMGLYQRRTREGLSGVIVRVVASFFLGSIAITLLFYAFPALFLGRGILGLAVLVGLAGIPALRILFMRVIDQEGLKRRVLILGAGQKASLITRLRRRGDFMGCSIIGFVHMPGEIDKVEPEKVIRLNGNLAQYCKQEAIDEIVVAADDRRRRLPLEEILDCKMSGVHICDLITFFERETGKIKLEIVNTSWLVFSDGFRTGSVRDLIKRMFDMISSAAVLLLTWPLMVGTAIAIWVESGGRGPIFYKQVRTGHNGQPFNVIKFRSMRTDAEKDGVARWATANDDRVTRVGKFIRKTRLDELPQLFNVLRGDMSFVGPRPERPEFVAQLAEKIPYYQERHRVKPGVTGWAQVCYPYGASEQDSFEKLQFDLYYVKNFSLFMDLMILLQTAEVVLWGKGAR